MLVFIPPEKRNIDLKQGELICNKCNGEGTCNMIESITKYITYEYFGCCDKCDGDGKVDWVKNIIGSRSTYIDHFDEMDRYHPDP